MSQSTFARIMRLASRIERGGVIPLLGAGISMPATYTGEVGGFQPSLAFMSRQLCEKLHEWFTERQLGGYGERCRQIQLLESILEECSSKKASRFDWLAELYGDLFGQDQLCSELQIGEFRWLQPTRAHRYIALLCREGLIGEIITTNYDTCIEKALDETFDSIERDPDSGYLQVITSLEEYRRKGGLRWHDWRDGTRPSLRLYKVNGCAERYASNAASHADSILLTERQLQTHAGQPWKVDLLRDRCRSHNLLLSGFGSEEPQVRHLFVSLQKEFVSGGAGGQITDVLELPNAPFIAAYQEPTLTQWQLMNEFITAHAPKEKDECKDNIFDCCDSKALASGVTAGLGEDAPLSADLFWKRVFQAVFKQLVERRTSSDSRFATWLATLTPHSNAWRGYLFSCLYPPLTEEEGKEQGKQLLHHHFGRYRGLLSYPRGEPPTKPIPLMRLLRLMYGRAVNREEDSNWYRPISEEPLSILTLFLFLCLFRVDTEKLFSDCLDPCDGHTGRHPRGVSICLAAADSCEQQKDAVRCLWPESIVLCHGSYQASVEQSPPRTSSRLVFRIVLPEAQLARGERRWRHEERPSQSGRVGRIRFGREHDICFSELISVLSVPPDCNPEKQCDYQRKLRRSLMALDSRWRDRRGHRRLRRLKLQWENV